MNPAPTPTITFRARIASPPKLGFFSRTSYVTCDVVDVTLPGFASGVLYAGHRQAMAELLWIGVDSSILIEGERHDDVNLVARRVVTIAREKVAGL